MKKHGATQTAENPQSIDATGSTELSEPEIGYQLSLFKEKIQKMKDMKLIKLLHERSIFSAKSLTMRLVESSQPICNLLSKHDAVEKENVILLLTRLQKMYQMKTDATKILNMFLKLEHDPSVLAKSDAEQTRMWNRLIYLLSQFEEEHHLYPKFIFDGYDLKQFAQNKKENLAISNPEKNKLPVIGRSIVQQEENRCMSRERGFNYESAANDEIYLQQQKQSLEEEKKLAASKSFGPKNVPRFVHPDDKKHMAAVKSDMKLLSFSYSAKLMTEPNGPESTEE